MDWYKPQRQTWTVTCPDCGKEWQMDSSVPGWMNAKKERDRGNTPRVVCNECLRAKRKPK